MHSLTHPGFSEQLFRDRPAGILLKFPGRLGQFLLSSPVDSRWGRAPSAKGSCRPLTPR